MPPIKKLFLKLSQYSQENACVGVSFLIKMQAYRPACEIFKNSYFEEHL